MTLLPEALLHDVESKAEEQVWLHNWLYSVVPVSKNSLVANALSAFLTGYCKNCSNVFSVEIPNATNGRYRQTQVGVPKIGCVGP